MSSFFSNLLKKSPSAAVMGTLLAWSFSEVKETNILPSLTSSTRFCIFWFISLQSEQQNFFSLETLSTLGWSRSSLFSMRPDSGLYSNSESSQSVLRQIPLTFVHKILKAKEFNGSFSESIKTLKL